MARPPGGWVDVDGYGYGSGSEEEEEREQEKDVESEDADMDADMDEDEVEDREEDDDDDADMNEAEDEDIDVSDSDEISSSDRPSQQHPSAETTPTQTYPFNNAIQIPAYSLQNLTLTSALLNNAADDICPICLDLLADEELEVVTTVPCGHRVCRECWRLWVEFCLRGMGEGGNGGREGVGCVGRGCRGTVFGVL